MCSLNLNGRDESVASARNGFDKSGIAGIISKSFSNLQYRNSQALVEFDKGILWLQSIPNLLARNNLPGAFESMPGYQERTTADGTALEFKQKILKRCPNATFTVLQEGKTDFTLEWQTTGCKDWDNQYEVSRFITGKTAMYRVLYTNRKVPIPEDKRRQWIDLIGKAFLRLRRPGQAFREWQCRERRGA